MIEKTKTKERDNNLKKDFLVIPPEMTKAEYAKLVNLEVGVINNQVARGILPSVKRGRHRLVNTAKIYQENIER